MKGLVGLGIGLAIGWASIGTQGTAPVLLWLLWGLSYLLVYLCGRRRREGASTAVATAVAVAKSESVAESRSEVKVFVNNQIGLGQVPDQFGDRLRATTWYAEVGDVDQAAAVERAAQMAISDGTLDVDGLDDLDPVELVERVRRGEGSAHDMIG